MNIVTHCPCRSVRLSRTGSVTKGSGRLAIYCSLMVADGRRVVPASYVMVSKRGVCKCARCRGMGASRLKGRVGAVLTRGRCANFAIGVLGRCAPFLTHIRKLRGVTMMRRRSAGTERRRVHGLVLGVSVWEKGSSRESRRPRGQNEATRKWIPYGMSRWDTGGFFLWSSRGGRCCLR